MLPMLICLRQHYYFSYGGNSAKRQNHVDKSLQMRTKRRLFPSFHISYASKTHLASWLNTFLVIFLLNCPLHISSICKFRISNDGLSIELDTITDTYVVSVHVEITDVKESKNQRDRRNREHYFHINKRIDTQEKIKCVRSIHNDIQYGVFEHMKAEESILFRL